MNASPQDISHVILSGVHSSNSSKYPGTTETLFKERTLQFSNKLLISLEKGSIVHIADQEEQEKEGETPNIITKTQTEIMNNYKL
jgi:hypothetical protein